MSVYLSGGSVLLDGGSVTTSEDCCCGGNTGACCHADNSCTIESEADCDGVYLGDGSTCDNNPCNDFCCGETFPGFLGDGFFRARTFTISESWDCDGVTGSNSFSVTQRYINDGFSCFFRLCSEASGNSNSSEPEECSKTLSCDGGDLVWSGDDPTHTCFGLLDNNGFFFECANTGLAVIDNTNSEGTQSCINFPPDCEGSDCCGYVTVHVALSDRCNPPL